MKIYKFFFLFFLTFHSVFSQISLGIKGGLSFSKTTTDTRNIDFTAPDYFLSLNAGICADFSVSSRLFIRSEINYIQKGFTIIKYFDASLFSTSNTQNASFWGTNYTYLQVPILLHYKIENENIKFYFGVGPYISYAVSGKKWANLFIPELGGEFYTQKFSSENYIFDINFDNDNRVDNRIDFGGIVNVGIARKLNFGEIIFEARYEHGFLDWHRFNISTPKTYSSVMNRGITISIGALFYIKKKYSETSTDQTD